MTQCIVTNHEFKDLKGWEDYGISLSTTSNEAAKMLDALMMQLFHYNENETLGGIVGTLKRLKEADPTYVLGPLFETRFKLWSYSLDKSSLLQESLKEMEDLARTQPVNEWEKKLVGVIKDFATGHRKKSLRTLEGMISDNPKDIVSLKFAYLFALMLGDWTEMKIIFPKVLANWTPNMVHYGYINGMYGYILNEFKNPSEAEKYTSKALNIHPNDVWSTHATAHILNDTNRAEDGVKFMEKNEPNWGTGTYLLEHNYWHWALFLLDKGDYESVLGILDDSIIAKCSHGTAFPLCDASSLLYRLEMEGVPIGKRWETISALWSSSEHASVFVDVHTMMNYLGAKDYESANSLLDSSEKYARESKGTNYVVMKEVGLSLHEAMIAFDKAKYDDVVELLLPVRDEVLRIGGSNAQRDVFNLLLIRAAIQCSSSKYKKLGRKLIDERKQLLGETGVVDRLEQSLLERPETK